MVSLFRPNPKPGDVIDIAGRPVRLRVNARARRISLRVDPNRREVVAIAPSARKLAEALRFAESRAGWIAERLAVLPEPRPLRPGMLIEVGGAPCRLERAAMRITPRLIPATAEEPQRLLAYGDDEAYGRAAVRALKAEALTRLKARTLIHAQRLNQPIPVISVADAKGRWGSCKPGSKSRAAAIRYSWRLILAPMAVLDYVAAHEAAHLIEANHGPGFWSLVAQLYGDHRAARRWLRTHGGTVQAVRP